MKLVTGPSARVCGVNRKQFLITTGTAASGAAISLLLLRSNLNGALPPLQQPIFLAQMFDRETLRRIGVGYRNTHPEEDGVAQLTNLLGSAARTDSQVSADKQSRQLQRQVEDDFTNGRITMVDGWVLSVTEARQCALLSIVAGRLP